eukprot:scaffold80933_cov37-Prasinocladus_malaysianus.AAC.1
MYEYSYDYPVAVRCIRTDTVSPFPRRYHPNSMCGLRARRPRRGRGSSFKVNARTSYKCMATCNRTTACARGLFSYRYEYGVATTEHQCFSGS